MASRSIDLIGKKTSLHVQHAFFLISKKQICTCSTLVCLSLPLFCTTTMPFCTTKTSNFLVTQYFYGGIVVCAYQRFFSLPLIFSSLAASISYFLTAAMKFSCFSSHEIRVLYFQSLALALSLLSTWL